MSGMTDRREKASRWLKSRYPEAHSRGATRPGTLYNFPWECMGTWGKLWIFFPYFLAVVSNRDDSDHWCFHILLIALLRYGHAFAWNMIARNPWLSSRTRIYKARRVEFDQVDREDNWDDYIILQTLVASIVHWLPYLYCDSQSCHKFAHFDAFPKQHSDWFQLYLWHAGPTECIYYILHRALHEHSLFAAYHSHHHASFVTEPTTGSVHPFAEHLMYTANFALPLLGTWLTGGFSICILYAYLLGFDFFNCLGHCNFEVMPPWLYCKYSPLRLLLYTPTFHSLHHSKVRANFSLFMPLYDYLGGTVEPRSWTLQREAWYIGEPVEPPDAIFLAHGTDLASIIHLPYISKSLSAQPYALNPFAKVLAWPFALPSMLYLRYLRKPDSLPHSRYELIKEHQSADHLRVEVRTSPAIAIHYAFKSQWPFLNAAIDQAIVNADKAGVRVIGLGALNKNEALNGGGSLFVNARPHLKVRVVHGNTLTAAAVLATIPASTTEVFCVGATSKLGRALSIYLAARGITVKMLTASHSRFESVVRDAKLHLIQDYQWSDAAAQHAVSHRLVRCDSLAEGIDCSVWLIGKPITYSEQCKYAKSDTLFAQFVVPPLEATGKIRQDCQYAPLPAFQLPRTRGVRSCEMMMDRGVVFACHAGLLIHALENWTHHEVGAVNPNRIDTCWHAAMRHAFQLVTLPWQCPAKLSILGHPPVQPALQVQA